MDRMRKSTKAVIVQQDDAAGDQGQVGHAGAQSALA